MIHISIYSFKAGFRKVHSRADVAAPTTGHAHQCGKQCDAIVSAAERRLLLHVSQLSDLPGGEALTCYLQFRIGGQEPIR